MEQLTVILRQHTPMIHFQHNESRATLRASEVKPRLDKFIIEHDKEHEKSDFNYWKQYLIGYRIIPDGDLQSKFEQTRKPYRALNYKIRIEPQGEAEYKIPIKQIKGKYRTNIYGEDFPFLLSNMEGKENMDDLINFSYYRTIMIHFSSPKKIVKDLLKQYIEYFFVRNNFGQRKTKGFGSFTVIDIIDGEISQDLHTIEEMLPKRTPFMLFRLEHRNEFIDRQYTLFKVLDYYWKCLKSGVNYTKGNEKLYKRYQKSFLFKYLNNYLDEGNTWEKRAIKQHFNLVADDRDIEENYNTPTFARALLGAPDKFEYKNKESVVTIKHAEENKERRIARIPSPIIFKPIITDEGEVKIYIIFDPNIRRELRQTDNLEFIFTLIANQHSIDRYQLVQNPKKLSIEIECIDSYRKLITTFHKSLNNKMIPRNFFWKNILENAPSNGKPSSNNGNKQSANYVTFHTT